MLGDPPPPLDRAAVLIFAVDHGATARGVSAYPAEVTAQMCANFAGGGAAVSVLTRACGAEVRVVDVGVAADLAGLKGIEHRKVRAGTADLSERPAMTADEVLEALAVGVGGSRPDTWLVGVGEMGIGNTSAAAAVAACLTGAAPSDVIGRGTGVDDAGIARKCAAVARGVARVERGVRPNDPAEVLREVGGLEIAAMAGAMIGAAARGALVLVDGFISSAAALAACRLCPALRPYLVACHRSTEPGHTVVLDALGLAPLLDLEMRTGEGSGSALAISIAFRLVLLAGLGSAAPAALVLAHCLARVGPVWLMVALPYVSGEGARNRQVARAGASQAVMATVVGGVGLVVLGGGGRCDRALRLAVPGAGRRGDRRFPGRSGAGERDRDPARGAGGGRRRTLRGRRIPRGRPLSPPVRLLAIRHAPVAVEGI